MKEKTVAFYIAVCYYKFPTLTVTEAKNAQNPINTRVPGVLK